jgi:hypothetical protein
MLNKTQSKNGILWSAHYYSIISNFVILFQVSSCTKERQNAVNQLESSQVIEITIDKNTTDEEIKNNIN